MMTTRCAQAARPAICSPSFADWLPRVLSAAAVGRSLR